VRRIATGLASNYGDYECTIITSNIDKRAIQELPEKVKVMRLSVLFRVREYALWRGLSKKLLMIDADIFHANSYGYWCVDALSVLSKFKRDFKIVFTTHGWEGFEFWMLRKQRMFPCTYPLKNRIIADLRPIYDFTLGRMELSCADALIALSPRERMLFAFMKVPKEKIFEILPGVDEGFFQSTDVKKNENTRDAFDSNPLLLTVGRLSITKGHDVAIKAMKFIVNDYPKAKLFIVGKDYGRLEYLKELARHLDLEKNVRFTGYLTQEKLILLYKTADLLIHTSYAEGVSLTVLEALAAGLPVVSTPAGGISYMLTESGAGRLVPFNNPHAVYLMVKHLIENPEVVKTMREKALKFGRNLSWSRAIKEHIKVYHDVMCSRVLT
jgi:glycosyltransferase involved in cell wall biosynthesis